MLPVAVLLVTFAGQSTTSPAVLSVALLLFTVLAVSPVRLWRLAQRGLQRLQNFPLHLGARFDALQRRDFSLEEAPCCHVADDAVGFVVRGSLDDAREGAIACLNVTTILRCIGAYSRKPMRSDYLPLSAADGG